MRKVVGLMLLLLLGLTVLTGCAEQVNLRQQKDREAAENGLNRILTVYDQNGNAIKTYEGKFDIEIGDGGKIKFDIPTGEGNQTKRVIIYNAVVICEEK